MVVMRRSEIVAGTKARQSREGARRKAHWRKRHECQSPLSHAASHVAKLDDLPGPASGGPVGRLDPLWDSLGLPTVDHVFPYNVRVWKHLLWHVDRELGFSASSLEIP